MESIHSQKKSGATRAGVLAAFLVLALLLALPCTWYAVYHDQMTASAKGVGPGTAPAARPSGAIILPPPTPGITRTVQIHHTGGQAITSIAYGSTTMTMSSPDPRPPSNPVDAFGQSLCDRYNAWKCEKGDPRQNANVIWASGNVSITSIENRQSGRPIGPTLFLFTGHATISSTGHIWGRRAP